MNIINNGSMVANVRKNYYEILGVSADCTFSEIKSAYRRLARKYHPDVNKSPESVQKFKDITEAYDTLSDSVKRKKYNTLNGFYKSNDSNADNKQSQNYSSSSYRYSKNSSAEFKKNSSDKVEPDKSQSTRFSDKKQKFEKKYEYHNEKQFTNVINDILDGISKNKKTKKQPKNGDDIYTEITISLEDSIKGCERVVNVLHKETCPACEGRRFINGSKCTVCQGSGEFVQHKKITVKVPQRTLNGTKLRVLKEGNPGFNGGVAGNLYLTVRVEPNSNIRIDGNNILYRMPLTPFEAVLGGKVDVPVFDGKVILTVPPMTRTGQKFRLKGEGLKTNNIFGDMIVTVEIQLPKSLSDDEIKLYEKLKKLSQGNIRDHLIHD